MADDLKNLQQKVQETLKLNKLTKDQTKYYQDQSAAIEAGGNNLGSWRQLLNDIDNNIDSISNNLDYVTQSFSDSLKELKGVNIALGMQKRSKY